MCYVVMCDVVMCNVVMCNVVMCSVVMCDVVMLNVSVEIELVIVSAAWLTNYLFIRVGVNKNNLPSIHHPQQIF